MDFADYRLTLDGSPVLLATIEHRLLAGLAANAVRALNYEHLLQQVWSRRTTATSTPCAPP